MEPPIDISIYELNDSSALILEAARLEHPQITAAIKLAVELLSSDKGRCEFATLALKFDNDSNTGTLFQGKLRNARGFLNGFVEQIRRVFPTVVVNHAMQECLMAVHPAKSWSGHFSFRNQFIHINGMRIISMKMAMLKHDFESWERLQFCLICTFVHEIAHLFITSLDPVAIRPSNPMNHSSAPRTPESICHSRAIKPVNALGEAGAYIEERLFGGYIVCAVDSRHKDRFGVPYLIPDRGMYAQEISSDTIRQLVGRAIITLPFETTRSRRRVDQFQEWGYRHRLDIYAGFLRDSHIQSTSVQRLRKKRLAASKEGGRVSKTVTRGKARPALTNNSKKPRSDRWAESRYIKRAPGH